MAKMEKDTAVRLKACKPGKTLINPFIMTPRRKLLRKITPKPT